MEQLTLPFPTLIEKIVEPVCMKLLGICTLWSGHKTIQTSLMTTNRYWPLISGALPTFSISTPSYT